MIRGFKQGGEKRRTIDAPAWIAQSLCHDGVFVAATEQRHMVTIMLDGQEVTRLAIQDIAQHREGVESNAP